MHTRSFINSAHAHDIKVAEKECSNDQQLKKAIIAAWRD